MIVRPMMANDIDSTVNLFNYYYDEAVQAIPSMNDEYDENSIINTIRNYSIAPQYVWFNLYDGQRPVGFIAGFVGQKPWNHNMMIGNISFIYILPSHRSMPVFRQLVDKFAEWAKQFNCVQITAGDIGIDIERSKSLYEFIGFKPVLLMVKETAE